MPSPIGEILFLVFLTFLEGFFVAAEIALVSVRRSRIDQLVEEGSSGARRVRRLIEDPGRFLAVSQLGLTLIGFFASAFAAVSLVDGLAVWTRELSRPGNERSPGVIEHETERARRLTALWEREIA